ncbi:hypothetical protein [Neobacillus drentensis]|uniref:hypothetical protein n=1 Tax=Neobacillus drentensis TaxID=220684 RepID=UPI002FFD7D0F
MKNTYMRLSIKKEGTRLLREKPVFGDPAGAKSQGGSWTARGKRSAWSGNQHGCLTKPIKKEGFHDIGSSYAYG